MQMHAQASTHRQEPLLPKDLFAALLFDDKKNRYPHYVVRTCWFASLYQMVRRQGGVLCLVRLLVLDELTIVLVSLSSIPLLFLLRD